MDMGGEPRADIAEQAYNLAPLVFELSKRRCDERLDREAVQDRYGSCEADVTHAAKTSC